MTTMKFMPELAKFLQKNGRIFTVRRYLMSNSPVNVYPPNSDEPLLCKRTLIKEGISMDDLQPYYKESGFQSKAQWFRAIKSFNPDNNDVLSLYSVVLIKPKEA